MLCFLCVCLLVICCLTYGTYVLQVPNAESEALAALFDDRSRVFVRHGAAHILPTTHSHVNAVRSFLLRFMS